MWARSSSDPLGAATARAQFEAPATVNAPLLQSLISKLAEDRRWIILDLGAARPQTIELMNRFRCRLDIADLADTLDTLNAAGDSDELSERAEALLPKRHAEPTDVVLCWDFLNYLERGVLSALMERVAARCRPGAFVHALIVYSERMQPEPGQFAPVDDGHLLNLSRAKLERIAPRYSAEDLHACLPDYTVERVRLLGNGMQEYLLRV